jgi:diketogulonate reductase-like aldo/keto reductase
LGDVFYGLINTCPIKEQVMKTLRLNNGFSIPVVGTGTNTFGKEGNVFSGTITYDTTELRSAIELGYRLIDTAIYYRKRFDGFQK